VQPSEFDPIAFFRAIERSGARALLIGRQALIVLGLPVLTKDYDFWLHPDDAATFNAAVATFDLHPNRSPEEARRAGRYVLENDERVDVLVARSVPTVTGTRVSFGGVWRRRRRVELDADVHITMPSLDDLILTKQFAARPKDAEDLRMLEVLRSQGVP
jgi:hypothetical protein